MRGDLERPYAAPEPASHAPACDHRVGSARFAADRALILAGGVNDGAEPCCTTTGCRPTREDSLHPRFQKLAWKSVLIPIVMPKPDLVALTGGYRKTPVLQIGVLPA